jgi:nicotinic acid mononucleotide adenylyltransferase
MEEEEKIKNKVGRPARSINYINVSYIDKEYTIVIQEADDLNEEEIREQLKEDNNCFNLYPNNVLEVYIN